MRARAIDPTAFVRPEIQAETAYHLEQPPYRVKLDQNEMPWDFPRPLKEEVARRLLARDWSRYPDFYAAPLRRALGERLGHPPAGVLVGNGSNQLLGLAIRALVPAGGEVLGADPTFSLFAGLIRQAGARPRFLPPRDDLALPMDQLAREVERHPRRPVILCSPNNPTGSVATVAQVERLLERLEAPLLLDNAYGELCSQDYLPLATRHPHLLIFRTFSKAWSLAGMRLGYLLAHPALTAELLKAQLPYGVDHAATAAGEVALERGGRYIARRLAVIRGRRPQWAAMLTRFGFEVFPSETNFLLVRTPAAWGEEGWRRVRRGLVERGILPRDVSRYPGCERCLRVSVAEGRALRVVSRALAEILGSPGDEPRATGEEEKR